VRLDGAEQGAYFTDLEGVAAGSDFSRHEALVGGDVKNLLPSLRQRGNLPPLTETCCLPPGPGKGASNTSPSTGPPVSATVVLKRTRGDDSVFRLVRPPREGLGKGVIVLIAWNGCGRLPGFLGHATTVTHRALVDGAPEILEDQGLSDLLQTGAYSGLE